MGTRRLTRTYLIRGFDRVLYSRPPSWADGSFVQEAEDEGRLILAKDIADAPALALAIRAMDRQAERFRLAISRRTVCPLTLRLEKSEEPSFDPQGVASATSTVRFSDHATVNVLPRDPPDKIEQLSENAARWVMTLVETKSFSGHPDETIKRLQLLIEELAEAYGNCLTAEQHGRLKEIKWVRDFVSHPVCESQKLCSFIASHLPDAVESVDPPRVRFDRTRLEHRNFVGRHDPIARSIANRLLDAAIAAIPS